MKLLPPTLARGQSTVRERVVLRLFSDIGSEVLCTDLMILNDISELKLTEDEENEYKLKIDQMPTQLAFDQLKKMLQATGNPSKSIVLEKNERRPVRNMLPEALESRRNRKITHVVNVDDALAGSSIKQRYKFGHFSMHVSII